MTKTCSKCKQEKPLASFDASKIRPDDYCRWCRSCREAFKEMINQPVLKQIEIAARNAKYAAAGIIIDGVKLSISIKVCKDCAVQYPATNNYFYKNKQTKDRLSRKCKKCTKRMVRNQPGPRDYRLTDAEKEERARKQRVKRQAIRKEAQKWAKRKAKNKKEYDEVGMLLTEM